MDEPTEPLLGALSATYTIERELGGGGMSRVFAAREVALDRPVVIKVLPPELASAVSIERFRREIQLAARLQHPHIVPVLSAGQAGESLYYTMPRVNGDSLRARLARSGELPILEAVRLMREIADALAAAHSQGVVHRDIKPENVLLSREHAVVTDFGVAKAIVAGGSDLQSGGLTSIGIALGTPTYMAPEQAAGDPSVDHRADIYALGVVAYEMLAGRPPFGGSPQAVLAAHMTSRAEPIGVVRQSVPPALAALVMRCLEKRAGDRPQTADDVVSELRQVEADGSSSRQVSGSAPRSAGHRAFLVAGVIAVAALAGGLAWWRGRPPVRAVAASIAIMPFHQAAGDTALSRIGRDLVLTVGANLDGVGELKIADPLSILAQAAASTEMATLDRDAAAARRFGARSFVRGTLVRIGSDVRADMKLYASDGVTEIAAATARGPAADFAALTDSVTWALLRNIWRNDAHPTPTLASVTTKSVPALRAFLDGERFMIQNRWASAESSFARAIEADSSFWLAYWRYDYARGWFLKPADTIAKRILDAHIDSLPERERLQARAMMTDSMPLAEAQSRALAERFPDSWMIRMRHADNLLHRWMLLGYPIDDARLGFEETVRLNPGFAPGWEHLIWIGLRTRDTALLARAIPRYDSLVNAATGPEGPGGSENRAIYAQLLQILRGDTARAMTELASQIRQSSTQLSWEPYANLPVKFGFPRVRNALTPLLSARATGPLSGLPFRLSDGFAFAERGKWSELLDALAYARTVAPPQMGDQFGLSLYSLAAIGAWTGSVDTTAPGRFRPVAERVALTGGADVRARLAWTDGIAAFARGDRAAMSAARSAIRAAAAPGQRSTMLDRSLAAFELAMQGASDRAALALDSLERERMILRPMMEETGFLTPVNRLAASRWLMARGDTVEAARLLTWAQLDVLDDSRVLIAVLAPLALHEQARIEEAQGHRDRALHLYTQFLDTYDLAPPGHRTLVAEAREAVARLSGLTEPKR